MKENKNISAFLDMDELEKLSVVGGSDTGSKITPNSETSISVSDVTAITALTITASMAFTCTPSCNA